MKYLLFAALFFKGCIAYGQSDLYFESRDSAAIKLIEWYEMHYQTDSIDLLNYRPFYGETRLVEFSGRSLLDQQDSNYLGDTSFHSTTLSNAYTTKPDTVKAKFLCSLSDSLFIVNGYWAIPARKSWYVDWEMIPESTRLDANKKPFPNNIIIWKSH